MPRRWVVERTFGWLGRFRRLARDYERLTETLAGWHWLAFLTLLRLDGHKVTDGTLKALRCTRSPYVTCTDGRWARPTRRWSRT